MTTPPTGPLGPMGDGDDQPDLGELLRSLMNGDIGDQDQLSKAMQEMGLPPIDPAMFAQAQAQFAAMMSSSDDDGFNLDMATDVARKTVSASGDSSITDNTSRNTQQTIQVAQLWLDQVTDFAATSGAKAWSRAEWVVATMPTWRRIIEPIADGVGDAMQRAMASQLGEFSMGDLGLPTGAMDQIRPMLAKLSGNVFALQAGQAVGALATEMLSGTEVGLPLIDDNAVVMVPANVARFAEGLELDPGAVHLYLALREAARTRLFAAVPWLSPAVLAAVQSYAGDIDIDTEGIESALRDAQSQDPEQLQELLQGKMFRPEPSEAQKRALTHLETLLALVEGWVDHVTEKAAAPHLPNVGALSEAVRRRRASGGPAEKTFASLVGLELRPRRMREAANLFAALEDSLGAQERDGAWAHPDFAPTAADLDDPMAYVARRKGEEVATETAPERDEMDDELDKLLSRGQFELDAERKESSAEPGELRRDEDDKDAGTGDGDDAHDA